MNPRLVSLLPIAFLLGWIVGTYSDWPVSWDEPDILLYGELISRYYLSRGADNAVFSFSNLYLYGGWMPLLLRGSASLFGNLFGYYESAHLFNAAVGSIALVAIWLIAVMLSGYRAGFFATLVLVTTPIYLGSIFNNFKDVPFAAFYAMSLYFILKISSWSSRARSRDAVTMGVSFGLAMGVRSGGILLWIVLLVACLLKRKMVNGAKSSLLSEAESIRWRINLYGSLMLSYGVMIAVWPWAQLNILVHPFLSATMLSRLPWVGATLFEGDYYPPGSLPVYYLPKMFALTMPISVLAGLILFGVVFALMWIRKESERLYQVLIILFAILFPVLISCYSGLVVYDGMRHFLFIVPLMAVLVGLALSRLIELTTKVWLRRVFDVAAFLLCTAHLPYLYSMHPFEYSYYNQEVAGGIEGAWGRYELDYWGYALRENVSCLARIAGAADRQMNYRLAYGDPEQVTTYSDRDPRTLIYRSIEKNEQADFRLMGVRWRCPDEDRWRSLGAVSRRGIPLSIIQVRSDLLPLASEAFRRCGSSWLSGDELSTKLEQLPILPYEPQICDR